MFGVRRQFSDVKLYIGEIIAYFLDSLCDELKILRTSKRYLFNMAWFTAFRGDFGNAYYGEYRTSVTADISFAAIAYTCVLISIAAIVAAAGIRGRERWYTLVRLTYSLAVGSIILVSIFGYCWQIGEVGVHSPYIYRSKGQISGRLGVHVGLKTVNLTLVGTFTTDGNRFKYNEKLTLGNVIQESSQLWTALDRGLPQTLLSMIDHFDTDEGGLRYGRNCFMAGYFANILLWTAFAFWVTGNILLCSVVWYGAACFTLAGVCMILAAGVYDFLCPQRALRMPCSDGPIELRFGWCFWATLVFGILTTVVGLVLFTLEQKVPKKLAEFFLLDTALEDDEYKQLSNANPLDSVVREDFVHRENYGFETTKPKFNPVFAENTLNSKPETDSSRTWAFSNIVEEDRTSEPGIIHSNGVCKEIPACDSRSDSERDIGRLTEIYVNIDPDKRFVSANLSNNRRASIW
ncbi:dual oxidase maturation factor 1-like isoform X7 [Dreissena polymorpha]|uniref:dual oxidase maturation factor 1-like isoform X7 n=1 Tax=Dreissena polymorpha TaxID=45954 RepID=UPI0022654E92|nr:dual oxidase maturation factor 1-like isoform X7 [Dreissena polymorpha]